MVKRIFSVAFLLLIIISCTVTANAEDNEVVIGRTYIYKPTVNVELYNVKENVDKCRVTLGNGELTVLNQEKYNESKHKTVVYLLIDKSKSNNSFQKLKSALCNFVDKLGKNHQLVYITFGDTVSKPITYSSCDNKAKLKIKKNINNINCNEKTSSLYDAMKNVYNMSVTENEKYDRRYSIVAASGQDKNQSLTSSQIRSLYDSHMLPTFALCGSNSGDNDKLSDICATSGGNAYKYTDSNPKNVVNDLSKYVNENVLLIKAKSSTNMAPASKRNLSVELNGKTVQSIVVPVHSKKDNVAPTAKISFNEDDYYDFSVEYSERVKNGDDYSRYKITGNGEDCEVEEVKKVDDTHYKIIMKNPISSGDYEFTFDGITDISVQHNNVEPVTIKDISSSKYIVKNIIFYGLIGIGCLVIIGLGVVIFIRSKNKKPEVVEIKKEIYNHYGSAENEVQHRVEFDNTNGVNITLTVTKQGTVAQVINSRVCGSIIVGRAEICDVCIDDNQMSRQHFALEENNNSIIITDLDTLNGTYINSFKISNPQRLNDGDEIIAGSCRIKFHYR